jgi:carbonic anhydrase
MRHAPLKIFLFILFALTPLSQSFADTAHSGPGVTPDQALQKLMEGNQRYVEGKMTHPQQGAERRKEVAQGQKPFAVILGCADSRTPPEVIFDQGLGDLFVVRAAGNVVDTMGLGSIEYATQVLGAPLIVVMGHSKCGAVDAALQKKPLPGHIQNLAEKIQGDLQGSSCKADANLLNCSIAANAQFISNELKNSEPVIAPLVKSGKVKVMSAVYDLETGKVEMMK